MKKVILLAAVALGAMSAQAQQVVEAPKFFDNWSVSLVGGGTTPIENAKFIKDMRGIAGIEIEKQVTPILALGVEGNWGINTSYSTGVNVFDDQYVGVYGAINLNKLFGACKCKTQLFEVEAVAGAGWGRAYDINNWSGTGVGNWYTGYDADHNFFATKAGLNFNFNVCKEVTVSLKPSMTWNMSDAAQGAGNDYVNGSSASASYDSHYARFNIMAGVTYHIGNKGFKCVRPYDQAEVDALNAQINDLRAQNDACNSNLNNWKNKAGKLQSELDACKAELAKKPKEVVKEETRVVIDQQTQLNSVRYVFFRQGSSKVGNDQKPNVEMVASFLKNHPDAKVSIKGYASPEGSIEVNEKLANARAEAVKTMLVKTYGIDANRIEAAGQGVGNMFAEPTWNRVSICVLEETK